MRIFQARQMTSSSSSAHQPLPADNKVVIFVKRPGENNAPTIDCFDVVPIDSPSEKDITSDQCIVRTLFLSVDPAQRCRMNPSTGVDYLGPYEIGEPVDGMEGVGVVERVGSACTLEVGDLVTGCIRLWTWTKYFVCDSSDLVKVNLPSSRNFSPSVILSCAGLSGITALLGIRKKALIDRSRPQTIVVSGAAGSCGSLAGQIARIEGCSKVIGICGSDDKCTVLKREFGFNDTINYKTENVSERLGHLAPEGIDIYWDNVGGVISDDVIRAMNNEGRVVLCGQIAVYNTDLPYPPPLPEHTTKIIKERNIQRERYLVLMYKDEIDEAVAQLSEWLQQDKIKVKETIYDGLNAAPSAFVDMMNGKNIGKMLIRP
ncbi:Prostaglandin reductase 2 [Caenorhabditis elegans]|uniref:Prostaglandin reductase 2 n=2 Tax=Caenorhabditis elegans TaxID=6239 RepID=Q0G840_CAEEL|nr:Prostaglandin reductase 2 [Caenorhabditis elegans]CAL36510.1 Prostaglandin reductase 2 [Caenorhabditis elegans]|eukprot:NP_001076629.1 Uncharacterized protein CELE_M106.3 [Caenorhabditis elegans]